MRSQSNLVRKHYLVSEDNIKKIEKLATMRGTSNADIVRQAIDAYTLHEDGDTGSPELMQLVSERLKEAVSATKKTRRHVTKVLQELCPVNA